MSNPFEAVILCLSNHLNQWSYTWTEAHKKEYRAAIRVLEAAGKIVDRRAELLSMLEEICTPNASAANAVRNWLKELIAALPDRGEK